VSEEEPVDPGAPADGKHADLNRGVISALMAVPAYFESELNVVEVDATDLYQFNSPLAGAIEKQTVRALNSLRMLWDPGKHYADYTFVRQPQRFPDVVLRSDSPTADPEVLLGIELKGWFAMAKEGVPTYRMKVNPQACNPWDLLAVYPWIFDSVVSGAPAVLTPFVRGIRWAAEYKNWWWQHNRKTNADRTITFADGIEPYPLKSAQIQDVPASDSGGNFGRLARTGIMNDWLEEVAEQEAAGIPLKEWTSFFVRFRG
jgi:hypothetical protein